MYDALKKCSCGSVYLAMEEVGDACRTHGAVVCQIRHGGVGHRLELIRLVVSKVFCSRNQVDELSAALYTHTHTCMHTLEISVKAAGGCCPTTRAWGHNLLRHCVKRLGKHYKLSETVGAASLVRQHLSWPCATNATRRKTGALLS